VIDTLWCHGHSCSVIGAARHDSDGSAPSSSTESPPQPEVEEVHLIIDEPDCCYECPSSEVDLRAPEVQTEPVQDLAMASTTLRRSTSGLKSTPSCQSLDVAVTVEVCEADATPPDDDRPFRSLRMNIPPVTISSHMSTPDDEPADQKYAIAVISSPGDRSSQLTSGLSSPVAQSRLHGSDSNPNLLSVSRTGTFSSGGSTRSCSLRPSNLQMPVDAQDIISVENGGRRASLSAALEQAQRDEATTTTTTTGSRHCGCFLLPPSGQSRRGLCLSLAKCCSGMWHPNYTSYISVRVTSRDTVGLRQAVTVLGA